MSVLGQDRRPKPSADNMLTVCFRVTRACNLTCAYCQAPPNSRQLSYSQLVDALTFLAEHGTERVKFTGGEPFVHRALLSLVEHCRSKGMEPTIITNGTILPDGSVEALRASRTRMKISLHGPREIHDQFQGKPVYDIALANLRKLIRAGIETSVHTLVHRESDLALRQWIEFLASEGVHKVSFMTFVPRGRGRSFEERWAFDNDQLTLLSEHVRRLGDQFKDMILVRFLDFARQPYLVFETDGSLIWEVGPETLDSVLLSAADLIQIAA